MTARLVLPVLLAALAACAQRPAATTPQPLVPKNGPDASVRVEYEGGLFNRRVTAMFSVERPAYVMVAHLGGDGVIRVLVPEDARETGFVPGKTRYRTDPISGDYDAAPSYWFMRPTVYRSVGAQSDSYDGNGHGFVFMIASDTPLRFDRISEFGLWDEFEVSSYATSHDPRVSIRQFANLVSGNGQYTLDYAANFSSYAVQSFAANRMDCAMLTSGFGMSPWFYSMGLSGFHRGGYASRGLGASCGGSPYNSYAYWQWRMAMQGQYAGPVFTPTLTPQGPTTPIADPKPIAPRPGRRDPLRPRPEVALTRPSFADRVDQAMPTRRAPVTSDRRAPSSEPVHRAPSTPHRSAFGGTREGVVNPRSARTSASPRTESRPSASPSAGSSGSTSSGASSGSTRSSSGAERASPPPKPVVKDP